MLAAPALRGEPSRSEVLLGFLLTWSPPGSCLKDMGKSVILGLTLSSGLLSLRDPPQWGQHLKQ